MSKRHYVTFPPPGPPDGVAATNFNKTTLQLLSELFRTTHTPLRCISTASFRNLFEHLNPAARIPNVRDVMNYRDTTVAPHPDSMCIVCKKHRPDKYTVALDIDTSAWILMTLILLERKTQREAKELIRSKSLTACKHHFNVVCLALITVFDMKETMDFSKTSLAKISEACTLYKILKEHRTRMVNDIMVPEFKEIIMRFLNLYYDPKAPISQEPSMDEEDEGEEYEGSSGTGTTDGSPEYAPSRSDFSRPSTSSSSSSSRPSTSTIQNRHVITLPNGRKMVRVAVPKSEVMQNSHLNYRFVKPIPGAGPGILAKDCSARSVAKREEKKKEEVPLKKVKLEIEEEPETRKMEMRTEEKVVDTLSGLEAQVKIEEP